MAYPIKYYTGSAWETLSQAAVDYSFVPQRNLLDNGAFVVWQRGTPVSTSAGYTADRWRFSGSASGTVSRSTDVPTGFQYSLSMAGSAGDHWVEQRLEAAAVIPFVGQAVTLSYWVKSTAGTSTFTPSIYYANTLDTWTSSTLSVSATTVTPSSTWTRYSYTFTMPVNAATGLAVRFTRASDTATTLIAGVKLEVGSVATAFQHKSFGEELRECQRYYWRTNSGSYLCMCQAYSTTNAIGFFQHPVPMRAFIVSGGFTAQGGSGDYYVYRADANIAAVTGAPTFLTGSDKTTGVTFSVASGLVAGNAAIAGAVTANGSFGFSADL